jgi:hypothetical protein
MDSRQRDGLSPIPTAHRQRLGKPRAVVAFAPVFAHSTELAEPTVPGKSPIDRFPFRSHSESFMAGCPCLDPRDPQRQAFFAGVVRSGTGRPTQTHHICSMFLLHQAGYPNLEFIRRISTQKPPAGGVPCGPGRGNRTAAPSRRNPWAGCRKSESPGKLPPRPPPPAPYCANVCG